jgi:uncharacterized protein (TIGR00251 family)
MQAKSKTARGGFVPAFTKAAVPVHARAVPASFPKNSGANCTLELKVIPNAPRDEVSGWLGGALKVKVHAPALDGRANAALAEFLASQLGLPRRAVVLVRGEKSRHKAMRIDGMSLEEVRDRLGV